MIGLSGLDQMRTHPRAAMERIDLYLDRLEAPAPLPAPDDRTAHDLIRMAGLRGLTALAESPRTFDRTGDRSARIQDLRETALETARALRRRRETGEGP